MDRRAVNCYRSSPIGKITSVLAFLWMHGPAGAFAAEANEKEASLGSHGPLLVLAEPIFAWRSEARNEKPTSCLRPLTTTKARAKEQEEFFYLNRL